MASSLARRKSFLDDDLQIQVQQLSSQVEEVKNLDKPSQLKRILQSFNKTLGKIMTSVDPHAMNFSNSTQRSISPLLKVKDNY